MRIEPEVTGKSGGGIHRETVAKGEQGRGPGSLIDFVAQVVAHQVVRLCGDLLSEVDAVARAEDYLGQLPGEAHARSKVVAIGLIGLVHVSQSRRLGQGGVVEIEQIVAGL